MDKLQSWVLYSLILREWPSRDFGHLKDHFVAFTYNGIGKNSFKAIAKSLFGIEDFQPGKALSELQQSNLTEEDQAYVFPLPARLASLLTPSPTTYLTHKVGKTMFEK